MILIIACNKAMFSGYFVTVVLRGKTKRNEDKKRVVGILCYCGLEDYWKVCLINRGKREMG